MGYLSGRPNSNDPRDFPGEPRDEIGERLVRGHPVDVRSLTDREVDFVKRLAHRIEELRVAAPHGGKVTPYIVAQALGDTERVFG